MSATRANLGRLWLASMMLASAPALASITPEAQAVVDRYLQAVGGRDALLAERAARVHGTVSAFGLTGTVVAWSQRPDKAANVTTIGPFTLREGDDGSRAWRVDQNGKLSTRDGKDLEDTRASTWFENDQWLMPEQGGGRVALVATERDSAGTYRVLEVTPPVGRARRFWFSERTGLLDRVVTRQDQRTVTNWLSDYRPIGGRLRPRTTRIEIEGMPGNTAQLTLDSVEVNPVLDASLFSPPHGRAADALILGDSASVRIGFHYGTRHVWVRASVNGGPLESFLLDTGASVTVIDSAYASQRGLATQGRIEVSGAGASGGASFSQIDSLAVPGLQDGGVVLLGQKVAVLSINAYVEPFFWRPLAGILGYDFISRFVLEVDYDRGTLTLHDPKRFRYTGSGAAIPMTMAGNIPVVKAKLDGQYEGDFRLDVGSGSTVDLHRPFVERNGLRRRLTKSYEVVGGGFGGTFTSTICRMKKMEIGPYAWTDPLVVLSQTSQGALASEDYAGNIGNHVLERFKCTFDYDRRVVHLEPSRRFASRDRFSLAGFQLARLEGRVRAMQVLAGSPAAQAGLLAGDEVATLDGKPIASYDVDGLRAMFEDGVPGRKHTLEVIRDGKKRKITIRLEELL